MPMVATKGSYVLLLKDDEMADNPRESCDNFGTMVCFHRRYTLGDKHSHDSPHDFLRWLVASEVSPKDVIAYVKADKADGVKLEYNPSSRQWEVNAYADFFKKCFTEAEFSAPIKGQESDISEALIENLDLDDLTSLADEACCLLPLHLYDHSGITMNTTGFSCPWDSGQVGWIYATKDAVVKEYGGDGLTPENREKAETLMQGEVEYYDHYLRGDCYGFELYKDGVEEDSCWGFIGDPDDLRSDIEGYLPQECQGIFNNLTYRYDNPDIDDIMQELEESEEMEVG